MADTEHGNNPHDAGGEPSTRGPDTIGRDTGSMGGLPRHDGSGQDHRETQQDAGFRGLSFGRRLVAKVTGALFSTRRRDISPRDREQALLGLPVASHVRARMPEMKELPRSRAPNHTGIDTHRFPAPQVTNIPVRPSDRPTIDKVEKSARPVIHDMPQDLFRQVKTRPAVNNYVGDQYQSPGVKDVTKRTTTTPNITPPAERRLVPTPAVTQPNVEGFDKPTVNAGATRSEGSPLFRSTPSFGSGSTLGTFWYHK